MFYILSLAIGALILFASQPKEIIFCRSKGADCWALCSGTFSDRAELTANICLTSPVEKWWHATFFPQGCQFFQWTLINLIIHCFRKPQNPTYFFLKATGGHSLPCESCSSDSQAQNCLKVTSFLWMMQPSSSGKSAIPISIKLENYRYLFSAEKLQLHIARCPPSIKKWNHQWARVPSKKKLSDTKTETGLFTANRESE